GLGFYFHKLGPGTAIIWYFVLIRSIDGYTQAFGAPGMVKMNAAWFARPERGGFAGIFGLMINLGRFTLGRLAPFLLVGFTFWGYKIPPGQWQLVFFVPAAIVVVVTSFMLLLTQPTPEAAGYAGIIPHEALDGTGEAPLPLGYVLQTILGNRLVWLTAWAYFCTGVVRSGVDSWFPKYFVEARHLSMDATTFDFVAYGVPAAATLGSIISGYVSDLFFRGRRAPVAACLYLTETLLILIGARTGSLWGTAATLVAVAFTCNATHSILGAAAPMDFGGRKMAGFACGVIDSWQYIGAGLAGIGIGRLIDRFGWGAWLYSMACFGVLGFILMLIMNHWEQRAPRMAGGALPGAIEADR
ncbi:MAG TPA: MFS transporter, partial [Rhodocyclaceae bacterium]|nr:MFS transporter [Rhodocyclaceae bacterium]